VDKLLPTPREACERLKFQLSEDQAYGVICNVYKPLLEIIERLDAKIKSIEIKLDNPKEVI